MCKKLLAMALAVVMLFALAVPAMAATVGDTAFVGTGDTAVAAKKDQAPVYKDGEVYDTLEIVYSGNSSSNHGYKISANKSYNTISLDGVDVGYFTFDKKGNGPKGYTDFLTITITNDDYVVDVRWDCSKYYAYASLDGSGTYLLPQLMQDNGKIQSFDQIWIAVSKKETPPPAFYGALSIQKTVGGVPFDEWAAKMGLDAIDIIDGMQFTAYLLDGENGNRVSGKVYPGDMDANGVITFGEELPIGWYEVEEEVSGAALTYFVDEGGTQVYYVGEMGVSAGIEDIISGMDGVGTVISATRMGEDGARREWNLPEVWNTQLGADPTFQKLQTMGAQWIWDKEDTYEYGIDGSVVRFDFTVDVAEETTAPIYFAADNAAAIYVNGELAAWTTVAFADREIPTTITEEMTAAELFDSLEYDQFDGRWLEGWANVYEQDITLAAGENTITIFAANSASKGYYDDDGNFVRGNTGTDNDGYNLTNNPCGLIFGFQLPGATFDNKSLVEKYGEMSATIDITGTRDVIEYGYTPNTTTKEGSFTADGKNTDHKWFGCTLVNVESAKAGSIGVNVLRSGNGQNDLIPFSYEISVDDDGYVWLTFPELASGSVHAKLLGDDAKVGNNGGHATASGDYNTGLNVGSAAEVKLYLHFESITYFDGTYTQYVASTTSETVPYTGMLSLVVKNSEDKDIFSATGTLEDLKEAEILDYMGTIAIPGDHPAGTYTATLSGEGFDSISSTQEKVNIGDDISFDFGQISVTYPPREINPNPPASTTTERLILDLFFFDSSLDSLSPTAELPAANNPDADAIVPEGEEESVDGIDGIGVDGNGDGDIGDADDGDTDDGDTDTEDDAE